MKPIVKRLLQVVGGVVALGALGMGSFVYMQTSAYDASMQKVYEVPIPTITRSTEPAVIARGKHVMDAIAACSASDCHGADLAGGNSLLMGPVATFTAPNITSAGLGVAYTDGELARLIKHGIKKDGRSATFMPSQDFGWLPDDDVAALISYYRTLPGVEKPNGPSGVKTLGKVLDRQGKFPLDIARAIDHSQTEKVPPPAANAEYGKFLGRMCTGCHGVTLSGGPLPGAPASFAVPANLTPDPTGLAGWTYEDFDRLLTQGIRKSGKPLDKLMPIQAFGQMDDTEKHALWQYLKTLPPKPFGNR